MARASWPFTLKLGPINVLYEQECLARARLWRSLIGFVEMVSGPFPSEVEKFMK